MVAGIDRLAGYRDALTEAGGSADPDLVADRATSARRAARPRWRACSARRPDIDAVFAASDLMAAGAIRRCATPGRRVPDDVAVVGFDDSPIAAMADPALTSVRQPIEEMGDEMTRLLIDRRRPGRPRPCAA